MSVTIKDIARLANVSHTTVSRALNDSPLINEDTKLKIKAIAKQLKYTPNISAKSLVLHRSYNIGLFFSTLNTGTSAGFFYDVVRGVNGVIKDRYKLIVKGIDDYKEYGTVTKKSFDGIIVMSQSSDDNRFIRHAMDQQIPLVVLNREIKYGAVTNILSDDLRGARNIVKYLIDQGHRAIAIIEGKRGFQSAQDRKEGYLQALRHSSIPVKPEFEVIGNYDMESGYQAMHHLLVQPRLPSAVFCSNDEMAVGAIKAILEKGLKVPDDLSIVGFDDNIVSAFVTPALTTVRRPIEKVSREGASRLVDLIDNDEAPKEALYMNTELIIRQSVKKLDRGDSDIS
jgi:DNA-binding LacI/PurR family transcriptional regulator